MKKIKILISFLIFTMIGNAQILDKSKYIHYGSLSYYDSLNVASENKDSTLFEVGRITIYPYAPTQYVKKGSKIYKKNYLNKLELLYDYNLVKGDSILVEGVNKFIFHVDSVKSVKLFDGKMYRHWYLKMKSYTKESVIWIENLGSLNGWNYPAYIGKFDVSTHIHSICHKQNLIHWNENFVGFYPNKPTPSCDFNSLEKLVENTSISTGKRQNITLLSNPTHNFFQIISTNSLKNKVQIYNTLGKKVHQQTFSAASKIDVSKLPAGIYNVIINNKNGLFKSKKLIIDR